MTVWVGTVNMDCGDKGFISFRIPFNETSIAASIREMMIREDIIRYTRTRGSSTGDESRFQRGTGCWAGDSSLSWDVEILDSPWRNEADSGSGGS